MQLWTFPAVNSAVDIDPLDARTGRARLAFAVPETVTAGLVQIDYLLAGSSQWKTYYAGASANMGRFRIADLNNLDIYVVGEVAKLRIILTSVVGSGDIALATYSDEIALPASLLTNKAGRNARLRVDVGQSGFFDGREFRTFYEFNTATAQHFQITVPINIIFKALSIGLVDGSIRFSTWAGSTESGTFDTSLPVIAKNRMTEAPQPPYASQVTIKTGGTRTGGTQLDSIRLATTNQSANVAAVGEGADNERGILAGTYHFSLEVLSGTAIGVFRATWEERP